jgi:serine/threonine-protein kinase RsbW
MKKTWPASLASVPAIGNHILAQLSLLALDSTQKLKLKLALEEVLVNIVNHAYKGFPGNRVILELENRPDSISVRIADTGPPFNPLETQDPDITADISDRKIGGLGIFLVKQMADQLAYQRVGQQNRLTLIFNRTP